MLRPTFPLETERLLLRPYTGDDLDSFHAIARREDVHRYLYSEGRLAARNVESARVLERLGMRREAHLRENEFIKGEWCDELVNAMLASEWRARSEAEDA